MSSASEIPRIGIGVFVIDPKTQTFIIGQRLGSHGSGTHALPGGHLEHGETFEDCAERETLEETGLKLAHLRFLTATNSVALDGTKHYVTIFMVAERANDDQQPLNLEPNKCAGWRWIDWKEFLEWTRDDGRGRDGVRLFQPMLNLIQQRPGINPFSVPSRPPSSV